MAYGQITCPVVGRLPPIGHVVGHAGLGEPCPVQHIQGSQDASRTPVIGVIRSRRAPVVAGPGESFGHLGGAVEQWIAGQVCAGRRERHLQVADGHVGTTYEMPDWCQHGPEIETTCSSRCGHHCVVDQGVAGECDAHRVLLNRMQGLEEQAGADDRPSVDRGQISRRLMRQSRASGCRRALRL